MTDDRELIATTAALGVEVKHLAESTRELAEAVGKLAERVEVLEKKDAKKEGTWSAIGAAAKGLWAVIGGAAALLLQWLADKLLGTH